MSRCTQPLDAAILADYWLGGLPVSEEDAVEAHLLACDDCASRLRETVALAEAVRDVVRQGNLLMVVSETFLDRLSEQGLRVREYAPPNSGSVACTVGLEDDFLIGHLAADLSAASRVDLSLCDAQGVERARLADIPFDPGGGRVSFQQPIGYAKAAPSETMIARLLGFDREGRQRLLGEYTFNHTRTIPGPPGW